MSTTGGETIAARQDDESVSHARQLASVQGSGADAVPRCIGKVVVVLEAQRQGR